MGDRQGRRLLPGGRRKEAQGPGGYFYLSMVSWSRLAIGFWTQEVVEEYIDRIDRAIAVAREQIEDRNDTAWTYFYLGGALGSRAGFT